MVDTGSIGLNKEFYWAILVRGTPQIVDRYRQVKKAAAWAVLEAKILVLEEFGKPWRIATSQPRKKFGHLRRGEQCSANNVYSVGGDLLVDTPLQHCGAVRNSTAGVADPVDGNCV